MGLTPRLHLVAACAGPVPVSSRFWTLPGGRKRNANDQRPVASIPPLLHTVAGPVWMRGLKHPDVTAQSPQRLLKFLLKILKTRCDRDARWPEGANHLKAHIAALVRSSWRAAIYAGRVRKTLTRARMRSGSS